MIKRKRKNCIDGAMSIPNGCTVDFDVSLAENKLNIKQAIYKESIKNKIQEVSDYQYKKMLLNYPEDNILKMAYNKHDKTN